MANWKIPFSTKTDSTFTYGGDTYKLTRLVQNKFDDSWSFGIEAYASGLSVDGIVLVGGKDMLEAVNIGLPSLFAVNTKDIAQEPVPENMQLYILEGVSYG